MTLSKNGIPNQSELQSFLPDNIRVEAGPIAVAECFSSVTCVSCIKSCPHEALYKDLSTNILHVDSSLCTGCGVCIPQCPAHAIFIIDANTQNSWGVLKTAYEGSSFITEGDSVVGLGRDGNKLGEFEVTQALLNKNANKTMIIALKVPKHLLNDIRGIRKEKNE